MHDIFTQLANNVVVMLHLSILTIAKLLEGRTRSCLIFNLPYLTVMENVQCTFIDE